MGAVIKTLQTESLKDFRLMTIAAARLGLRWRAEVWGCVDHQHGGVDLLATATPVKSIGLNFVTVSLDGEEVRTRASDGGYYSLDLLM